MATISFHRPARRNAWTTELEEQYFGYLLKAAADPDVRVIVITGSPEGKTFCPGLDTSDLSDAAQGSRPLGDSERLPHTLPAMIPKPIIAAINGACAGLGLIQALFADIRFASRTANLTTAFARRGLPAENGIAWILPRIVGTGVAADLLLSGRVFTGEEAAQIGLVNRAYDPDELMPAVLDYARDIAANCAPHALGLIKGQLYDGLETGMEAGRKRALIALLRDRSNAEFAEGVASFVERRPAHFDGISASVEVARDPLPKRAPKG